jgi:class 3 adenylate cyclase/tetratricopeptide (TPR) repeat protein
MPVCQRCGEDNPERARYCLACAAPLAASRRRREERKVVSVIFCDLVGFTAQADQADPEEVQARLGPYHDRTRREIERFGGTVEKFIGDAVVGVFGVPTAHEDDAERAVRAAIDVVEAIDRLNQASPGLDLAVRVAVNTGEAVVSVDAHPERGEHFVTGDVANTASRLQGVAPVGGVVVGETTWRATRRLIDYEPLPKVQVKGKAEPLPIWRAEGARSRFGVDVGQEPRSPLVARERELELVRAALARAQGEQKPQLVTLVGEPGIGKSRLVFELWREIEAQPGQVVWRQGRCLPYGEGVALWALGEIVKAQAGIQESDPADRAAGKLARVVAALIADQREAAWVTGHLSPLVGLAGGELGSDRREEAFAAWRRFCEALAEQAPAVLVMEDLHWADEALLDFLDHMLDWAVDVPLLVVATARPELLSRRPGWGGNGTPSSAIVSLSPLSEADTARLVAGLLDQALVPAELQAALLARAGGNPLYAEEYVRMLADRGFLRRVGGSWRLDTTSELPLPESVQGIIAARLDTLAREDKALLQDAAVLGTVGWLGALAAVAEGEPFALEARLHALDRREFVRRERRSAVAGERQYAFRHVLVRDVAYGQLPRAARADKHRRAAEWLEAVAPDRVEDRAELLAHHWQLALEFARVAGQDTTMLADRARIALRNAGDRALDLNAFAAADRWYAAALEQWPTGDAERPQVLLRLGRARVYAEQAGADLLAEARDGLLTIGDREAAAEAEALLGQLTRWQGQGEESLEHARQAAALLEGSEPSQAKAFALVNLSSCLMLSGRNEEAIRVGRQALVLARLVGDRGLQARAHGSIGGARSFGGDAGGIVDFEQALAVAVDANSPYSANAYGNLASCVISRGELNRGFELQAKGREAAERFGLANELRIVQAERVLEDYWRGRWEAAVAGADRFIAETARGVRHFMEDVCRLVRGRIRLARGDLAGALDDAAADVELGRQQGAPEALQAALALQAHALLVAGSVEEADGRASEVLALLAEHGVLVTNPDWSGGLAIVLHDLGRGAELIELVAKVSPPTSWLQAAMAVAGGDFEEAAELYGEIGSLPDEAFARLRAAELLLQAGRRADAEDQLQRALAFCRKVEAVAHLRQAMALRIDSAS